jgi:hypothetical protein
MSGCYFCQAISGVISSDIQHCLTILLLCHSMPLSESAWSSAKGCIQVVVHCVCLPQSSQDGQPQPRYRCWLMDLVSVVSRLESSFECWSSSHSHWVMTRRWETEHWKYLSGRLSKVRQTHHMPTLIGQGSPRRRYFRETIPGYIYIVSLLVYSVIYYLRRDESKL